jgi:hypothetical protein
VSAEEADYKVRLAFAEAELGRLVRRLRSLSPAAWQERRSSVLPGLGRLVVLTALAERQEVLELPAPADHVLADVAAVVGGDAIIALGIGPDDNLLADVIAEIRGILDVTR